MKTTALVVLTVFLSGCGIQRIIPEAQPAAPAKKTVMITEVMSANSKTLTDGETSPDWIEIRNYTESEIPLNRYVLSEDMQGKNCFFFPDVTLAPGECLLVYADSARASGDAGGTLNVGFSLGRNGGELCFWNADGGLLQQLVIPALGTDISYAYSEKTDSFGYCACPTPGAANADADIVPQQDVLLLEREKKKTVSAVLNPMDGDAPVRINEILVDNKWSLTDAEGERSAWVELKNRSDRTVSLSGYFLSDKADEPYRWAFPDVEIAPGEYLVVFLSGKDRTGEELHASFRLSRKDGTLFLTDSASDETDCFAFPNSIPENVSVGRSDGDELCYYGLPTPGYENAAAFPTVGEVASYDLNGVHLSELSAAGAPKSGQPDWAELRNGGEEQAIEGWRLTDNPDREGVFLSGTVAAGGYSVIELNDADGFGFSVSGERLFLYDEENRLRDIFSYGALCAGITAGREADASAATVYYMEETKGEPNGTALRAAPPVPVADVTGLYHSEPFLLTLKSAGADTVIRYTTDGSEPTEESPAYTEPLTVEKTTVLRAKAFRAGSLSSGELALTYLFTEPHTVPVFCVIGEQSEINAIFEESALSKRPEYRVEMDFYEADGTLGTFFPCDMRIKGNQSSSNLYPQKSVVCHLRAAYGQSSLTYPLFDGTFQTMKAFALRNGGQESSRTHLRDALASRLAAGLNVESAKTRLAVLYRNGEYQGLFYLTEQMNEEWLAAKYNLDVSGIEIVDRVAGVLAGTGETYAAAVSYAKRKSLRSDENYEIFCESVDMDSLIDYLILKTYLSDCDMYNQRYWSYNGGALRSIFFDNDLTLMAREENDTIFERYFKTGTTKYAGMVFNAAVRKNAMWREEFVNRFAELTAGPLSEGHIIDVLEEMTAEMSPEIERHCKRFGKPKSKAVWESNIASLRKQVIGKREKLAEQIRREFGYTKEEMAGILARYS